VKLNQLFHIALQSIVNNKLRTSLTILGVVVGIFSIIVIMTIITMLQNSIENGLSQLNKNTFQQFLSFCDGSLNHFFAGGHIFHQTDGLAHGQNPGF